MIKLRPGQDKVAQYRKGYLAVPAVPGAGKTTVLAYLAANLIEEGFIEDGKILIVTYMNSAVANFRTRIGDYLEERGLSRNRGYEVRTLHSLALNILQEKPEDLLINDDFKLIDPKRKGRLIREIIREWSVDNPKFFLKYFTYDQEKKFGYEKALERWGENDFPRFISSMIGYFKINGLSWEKIRKLKDRVETNSYLDWALTIFAYYDRQMHQQGLLDFDDLLIHALNLLERDKKLLVRLQEKYSYVFEDEAQDSNRLQGKILRLLAGRKGNLVRVGDSNQAIMGTFTSADPKVFREFTSSKKVDKRSILYSSRSSEDIINLANYLVEWTVKEHPQVECRDALEEKYVYPVSEDDPFPNPKTEGYTIGVNVFKTSKQEIELLAKFAAKHAEENPENTIAILVPANYIIESLLEELNDCGVECQSLNDQLPDRIKIIEDLKKIILYLAEPHDKKLLLEILKEVILVDYFGEEGSLEFVERVFKEYSPEEIIYPIGGKVSFQEYVRGLVEPEKLSLFTEALEKLKLWLDASVKLPPDELVLFLAEQMGLKEEELAVAQNIALQIKSEIDLNPHWKLHEIADELPRMEDSFIQFAKRIYDRKGFEAAPGTVTVTTVHKAKGLEWDTVYLAYLTNDYYPSFLSDRFKADYYYLKDEYSNPLAIAKAELEELLGFRKWQDPQKEANLECISERLRLFYVGITRAKKNLMLTAHREVIYDNGNTKKVKAACPFIALEDFIRKVRKKYAVQRSG